MKLKLPKGAIAHAEKEFPRESCGLIVDGKYIACRNVATSPSEHFVIDSGDYKMALSIGDIQAIVHSHPGETAQPSVADKSACEETALPWAIISVIDGVAKDISWTEPSGYAAPLIGRPFVHGIHDCVSILLDFYEREIGFKFPAPEREDGWWERGGNLYLEGLPAYGFRRLQFGEPLQRGDIFLMQIRSAVPNHAGVYLPDGTLNSEPSGHPVPHCVLHHMYGQTSRRDIYGGYWLEKTVSTWRLQD